MSEQDEFERRLRDGLHAAVPDDPNTDAWAGAARRRSATTQRRALATVMTVTVVALAGITIPSLLPRGAETSMSSQAGGASAEPEATVARDQKERANTGSTAGPTAGPDCAAAGAATPAGDLPSGATSIRLCPAGEPGLMLVAPPDALADPAGVAEVIAAYNARPTPQPGQACTQELGPAYTLLIAYPDGTVWSVTGELYGCRTIGPRVGAQQVLDSFAKALRQQRGEAPDPDAVQDVPACTGAGGAYVPVRVSDLIGVQLCVGEQGEPRALTEAQQRRLLTGLRDHASTTFSMPRCSRTEPVHLLGWNAYGEPLRLDYTCGVVTFTQGSRIYGWTPTTADRAIIDKLAKG